MSTKRESRTASLRYQIGESMPEGAVKPAFEVSAAAQPVEAYCEEVHVVTQQQSSTAVIQPRVGVGSQHHFRVPARVTAKLLIVLSVALGSVYFLWEAVTQGSPVGIVTMCVALLTSGGGLLFLVRDWLIAANE